MADARVPPVDVELAHRRQLRDGAAAGFEERKFRRQGFMLLSSPLARLCAIGDAFFRKLSTLAVPA
jgi:hypothetical protein